MALAPVGIITYSRISHLKQTVESLQNNTLAFKSELFIFLDGPQEGEEELVGVVREYIYTIDGFKKVHIFERKTNSQIENAENGIRKLFDEYGKCIFMEDDVVTAPGFLEYMNAALEFYKDNPQILSVGGHTPNLQSLKNSSHDVYFVKRFHGWGAGYWSEKYFWDTKLPSFNEIIEDSRLTKSIDQFGNDLLPMIKLESEGSLNAYDVRATYFMNKHDLYMVLPRRTLVKNIGLDGSGLRCGNNDIYADDILSKKTTFNFTNKIELYANALKEYKKIYDRPNGALRFLGKVRKVFRLS
ncbi:glycosyltransferase [Oligoflexia bacterium]|nr:glycosyltransferase [Oligoflexia bacterium]